MQGMIQKDEEIAIVKNCPLQGKPDGVAAVERNASQQCLE